MKKLFRIAGMIVFTLILCSATNMSGIVFVQVHNGHPHGHLPHLKILSQLTEEQRETIHTTISEMRENGATYEKIYDALTELVEGFGIDLPEHWGKGHPGGHNNKFWSKLTDEQRQIVHEKIAEMREADATLEEIRDTVAELLKSFSIELPENWSKGFPGRHSHKREFWSKLTEEQRETIHQTVMEMQEGGATREEIHTAVAELLESFGIELPDKHDRKNDPGRFGQNRDSRMNQNRSVIAAANYPNPFNPPTKISYTLQSPEIVTLRVYNIQGQLIRTLVNSHQPAGSYTVFWDGLDENSEKVVSGVYIYRIDAGSESLTQRMILMK